jgi:GTP-binding protein
MIIQKTTYVISSPDHSSCPKPDRPEYAFIGRSNVGKSSLINMLTGVRQLAKTSATPGKTQLINHFDIVSKSKEQSPSQSWYLVDLPGYGFAKVSASQRKKWEKMIEGYIRQRENLVNLFVLIDARHSPQQNDLEFVDQMGEWQIPFGIVFTKADKETQKEVARHVREFTAAMQERWEALPPMWITSAEKKLGREQMLAFIQGMNREFNDNLKKKRS